MPRARVAALLLLAGMAACSTSESDRHNDPDGTGGTASSAPRTSLDSAAAGEDINTVPPPAENAQPTAPESGSPQSQTGGGGTPPGAAVPAAPATPDTSTARP